MQISELLCLETSSPCYMFDGSQQHRLICRNDDWTIVDKGLQRASPRVGKQILKIDRTKLKMERRDFFEPPGASRTEMRLSSVVVLRDHVLASTFLYPTYSSTT